jgi:hypothetical protein
MVNGCLSVLPVIQFRASAVQSICSLFFFSFSDQWMRVFAACDSTPRQRVFVFLLLTAPDRKERRGTRFLLCAV